jgi:hypothetical protein
MGRKKGSVPVLSIDSTSGMDMLTIKKTNRPNFQKLFSVCIKKLEIMSSNGHYRHHYRGNVGSSDVYAKQRELLLKYQGIDMGDGADLFGLVSPYQKPGVKLKSKRGKRGKKNKKNVRHIPSYPSSSSTLQRLLFDEGISDHGDIYLDSSLYSEDSAEAYVNDTNTHNKIIYFYENILEPSQKLEFSDVYSFDEYCREHNIEINDYDCKQLMSNSVTHCCVSPYGSYTSGKKILISDASYGGLRWLCCEDDAELQESALRYF